MRTRLWALLVMASLAAVPVGAQETRGNINGTVQDSSGVIPGATVTITNVDTGQTPAAGDQRQRLLRSAAAAAGPVSGHRRHAQLQGADPERDPALGRSVADLEADAGGRGDLRAGRRHREGAPPRHDVGVLGTELRSGADRRTADGVEHADSADPIRAGRRQPDHAGAGDLGPDRRSDQRRRAPCSAASAASTTRSTAPPTPAAAAASRARRTPT